MNQEWSEKNKYNSFNSMKGLIYYDHYEAIMRWMYHNEPYRKPPIPLPPPIECSLDPISLCNLNCYYCNSQRYLHDEPVGVKIMSKEYMEKLVDFMADWGVKGLCLGGGGESTLNKDVPHIMHYAFNKAMEVALVTNGTMLKDEVARASVVCRWVGISVDAADRMTYKRIHGVDMFDKVIPNIAWLTKNKTPSMSKTDIAFKFLVLPENVDTIYEACKLAKDLGVDDFHVRPVDLQRKDYKMAQKLNLDIGKIQEAFTRCHELETPKFHVYTVTHKYDENFHVMHQFKRCLASPLVIQCCTDGNCYVCVDHRMEDRFKLGSQENISEWWGSDRHRELLKSIYPVKECSRCTWSEYNRQIEECVVKDKLCRSFP